MKDKIKRPAILAVILMLVPVWALAEETKENRNITFAVLILGIAGIILLVCVWRMRILPFLEKHALAEEAEMIVHCVEAMFGRGHGEEKWNAALEKMAQHGWKADREEIRECLQAAWDILNTAQIAAGVKKGGAEEQMKDEKDEMV